MKKVTRLLLLIMLISYWAIGQNSVYDTTDKHYAGIDFRFSDDLNNWTFKFQKNRATKKDASIGHIAFWSIQRIDDNANKEFHSAWSPGISFEIFYLKDSIKAGELSEGIRSLSLCDTPQIGGDRFIIGNFIFVNGESCVLCYRKATNQEYCRPTINHIFSMLNVSINSSIRDLINQLSLSVKEATH